MAYYDTSLLAAYYCPEPLSEQVEVLILQDQDPVISQLTEVELYSAVARKIREGNLVAGDGEKIVRLYRHHVESLNLYRILMVEAEHYQLAGSWIRRFNLSLRILDALHLAVSVSAELPLFTADRKLAVVAEKLGLEVVCVS